MRLLAASGATAFVGLTETGHDVAWAVFVGAIGILLLRVCAKRR